MRKIRQPVVVHSNDTSFILASSGVPVKRLITKGSHGSEIILGVCEMKPGEQSIFWSSELDRKMDRLAREPEKFKDRPEIVHYGPWHEVYYIIKGDLVLQFGHDKEKMENMVLKRGDAVYLATGWIYRLKNTGADNAYFVWAGTPPLS